MIRKIALLIGLSLLITFLMPHRAALNADFVAGETWEAETLTAPFDIPIYKDAEQLEKERQELLADFNPFSDSTPPSRRRGCAPWRPTCGTSPT